MLTGVVAAPTLRDMTTGSLLKRSLVYHRRIHLWVALGVAVGAAVLAGALLVGDSVRGSLRDLTLDRLGAIDHALVADRYFRRDLASELAAAEGFETSFNKIAPAILIRGSVESAEGGGRASRVNIHGIDESFWSFYPTEPVELRLRDVALNESLAREVNAKEGDAVLLRFQTDTAVPRESVMGRKTDNVRTMRLQVAKIIPDRGPGRFGLSRIMLLGALAQFGCVAAALAGVDVWNFWAANVLVGVGWNFLFVTGTALLTETHTADERAKVQGFNDFVIFGVVATTAFTSGWVQNSFGWETVNWSVIPLILAVIGAALWIGAKRPAQIIDIIGHGIGGVGGRIYPARAQLIGARSQNLDVLPERARFACEHISGG